MAQCDWCGKRFKSRQAVRGHLRACKEYQSAELAEPGAQPAAERSIGSATAGERGPVEALTEQVQAEKLKLELRQVQDVHRELDEREAARAERERQKAEERRRQQREEAAIRARAEQERLAQEAREQRERELKQLRRKRIQEAKDQALGRRAPWGMPEDLKAQAREEIERKLSSLSVDDLPDRELAQIAEGIRDQLYGPWLEAKKRQEAEESARQRREQQERLAAMENEWEKRRQQERLDAKKTELIDRAKAYVLDELKHEDPDFEDIAPLDRWGVMLKVAEILAKELKGTESWAEVGERVDEILEEEL